MTQAQASTWTPTVKKESYPPGQAGPRKGLFKVAEKAAEGRSHPAVQQWVLEKLVEAGDPKTMKSRAIALLEANRRGYIWKNDPIGVEWIPGAHLLADGTLKGDDCDGLTVKLLADFLASAGNAGLRCAVVGHSYNDNHDISHVLGAIYIESERRWYYADPSSKTLPFGECAPYKYALWIEVPSLEKICEGTHCGLGAHHGPAPRPIRSADFVTVDGLPDSIEEYMVTGEVPQTLGDTPDQGVLQSLSDQITESFKALVDDLVGIGGSWTKFVDAYDTMRSVHDDLGIPLISEPQTALPGSSPQDQLVAQTGTQALVAAVGGTPVWTAADEQAALNLEEMVSIASAALKDAWDGKRRVIIDPTSGEVGIEALPTDQFRVSDTNGSPTLVETSTGQEANVDGTIGALPLIEIGLLAGAAVVITIARYYMIKAVCEAATGITTRITDTVVTKALLDCAQTPNAAQCIAARKAQADATAKEEKARGEAAAKKNESDPFVNLAKTLGWIVGGGAAAMVAFKLIDALPSKRKAA